MGKASGRRSFIKHLGLGSVGTMMMPAAKLLAQESTQGNIWDHGNAPAGTRLFNGAYTGANLTRVAFPIGGMGAGMFCMEGTGAISHMSVRNQPDVFNEPPIFAAVSVKGWKDGAKVLEGPVPDWKKFGFRDAGNGATGATFGLPRFRQVSFLPRFPFGTIRLSDADMPFSVELTGWSPFVPGNENESGLPVGGFEYKFTHIGTRSVDAIFSFNAKNFLQLENGENQITGIPQGFVLTEKGTREKPFRTDFAICSDDPSTVVDHCWFRGGWWDPLTMAWNHVKDASIAHHAPVDKDAPGASLYVPFSLKPKETRTIRVYFAWYCPQTDYTIGDVGTRKTTCDPASGCCNSPADIGLDKYDQDFSGKYYQPWYSSQFDQVEAVMTHWRQQYDELRRKSALFTESFYSSSLPPEVLEAVAANLSILKSPTIMRQYDGRLWNFEGCADSNGCCHGSCTHVWNYAQAIPHLFPAMERSLRATEFCESQDERGHQNFRSVLPIQPATHDFHAAADGQLGGIMKVYREWRISGDNEWLRKIYPMVQKSIDYCIDTWDPKRKGVIEEPHHNTYDIEFWGADGMHCTFYLGSLEAIIAMGKFLGHDMNTYEAILKKGKAYLEHDLYNGEFFIQKIQTTGLKTADPITAKSFGGEYSAEAKELLQKEGPKYQYGEGCLSDGVLGSWIARMCGLTDVVDQEKIASHLNAVHRYNLKLNLNEHANPQRPAFALGEEGGLLLCTWPRGGKLSLPFVYSDEVWTGIEHQVAAHLMLVGKIKEGLDIVRASRLRYDGKVRNPFNEYECGHWYARALSSYGYLQALTGMRYDAVDKTLYIDSKIGDFTCFLSTESGFGTVQFRMGKAVLKIAHGNIEVRQTNIGGKTAPYGKA